MLPCSLFHIYWFIIYEHESNCSCSLNGDIDSTSITKTRLVLKPIMSSSPGNAPFVNCLRGKHALGELVLVEDQQCVVPKKEPHVESLTPKATQRFRASTPGSSLRLRKRGRRINRRWANSHGRRWKAAPASPTVVHSPSLTVAMQPELDDVEGLLFVSFSSKVNYSKVSSAHISTSVMISFFFFFTPNWCDLLLWFPTLGPSQARLLSNKRA